MKMSVLPLEGIRVADFSWVLAGPIATRILGALGADIIKIETRKRPELSSRTGNFYEINTSKRGLTLDLSQPRGREVVKEIVRRSDVVVENFAAGVMERMGLGYDVVSQLNPGIIMLASSGLGKSGPDSSHVAYGSMIQCFALWASMIGDPDKPPVHGSVWTDYLTATQEAFLILAAIYQRQRTGLGQYIDLSMAEVTLCALPEPLMDYTMNGRTMRGAFNRDAWCAPHDTYRCAGPDQWVAISVSSDAQWQGLCRVLGYPEWAGETNPWADPLYRWQHESELRPMIEAWSRQVAHTEAMRILQENGVPATAVFNVGELVDVPHLQERGMFVEVQEKERSRITFGLPWSTETGRMGKFTPAPEVGQHNEEVLVSVLGLSEAEIAELVENKIVY
jgi:benzylsuccinate CoA-transferase BbsF subunit